MNKKITFIPATITKKDENKDNNIKLRVAAYCRVSTDSDEQATSYEAQIDHYSHYIKNHPGWVLAGIFADDGISGTNTKNRSEFKRMIDECRNGNIDMIITKSISRFARNTIDCLKHIRELKENNIPVFFEKENINTMDSKGEVLLTIMASLAQQESQSLSQNVKLGIQYRYQQGIVQINHNRFLGYTKNEDKKLVIVPEEAEIVKRIYREYLEGFNYKEIASGLERDGILTAAGKPKWHSSTLRKILTNEKYIGDALLQKTYTVDFLSKKRVVNNGIVPQYYIENDHEAIIPKDIFLQVQEEIKRRVDISNDDCGKRRTYSSKYALSSILFCGTCHDMYRRTSWKRQGQKQYVWRCITRLTKSDEKCSARTITEIQLQSMIVEAINKVLTNRERAVKILKTNISEVFENIHTEKIENLQKEIEKYQTLLMKRTVSQKDYTEITDKLYALRNEYDDAVSENNDIEKTKSAIKEMIDYLNEQTDFLIEYDDRLVRKLIDKIIIFDDYINVVFKSGIDMDIRG